MFFRPARRATDVLNNFMGFVEDIIVRSAFGAFIIINRHIYIPSDCFHLNIKIIELPDKGLDLGIRESLLS